MRFLYMEDGVLRERKRRVILAYKGRLRGAGSRYMRCDQLAGFAQRYFGETHDVTAEVLPHPQRKPGSWKKFLAKAKDAVVIALKGSLDILSEEEHAELRSASLGLGIDHIDGFGGGGVFQTVDLHIAASMASQDFMINKCTRISRRDGFEMPRIELIDHHADERIKPAAQPTDSELQIAYIGDLQNTYIPDEIASDMLKFSAQAQSDFEQTLLEIDKAHLHYCVRRETKLRQPKPFTKGFTAARADRNLICTPMVHDAIRFLGEDYPYMTQGEDRQDIIDTVAYARESIGSKEWQDGLTRVRAMHEAVVPERVAKQLIDVVNEFY